MSQGSSKISHTLVLHCNTSWLLCDVLRCSPSKQEGQNATGFKLNISFSCTALQYKLAFKATC